MSQGKEWLESFRVFGIGKKDGKKIIRKLGLTILSEHEKLFDRYWWYTFDPEQSTAVARERHFGTSSAFMNTIIYFLIILYHSPLPLAVALQGAVWRVTILFFECQ